MTEDTERGKNELSAGAGGERSPRRGTSGSRGPHDEESIRRRTYLRLGLILVVSFFLPMVTSAKSVIMLDFLSLRVLREEGIPALLKFMSLYPLLAGSAVILVAPRAKGLARPVALICIGLLPCVMPVDLAFLRAPSPREPLLAQELGLLLVAGGFMINAWGGLTALGIIGVYAGNRARYLRPKSTVALSVAAGGGAVYLASLLPIGPGLIWSVSSPLATALGFFLTDLARAYFVGTAVWAPEMSAGLRVFIGLLLLLHVGLFISAAVLSLQNAAKGGGAGKRAQQAYSLWTGGVGVLIGAFLAAFLYATAGGESWSILQGLSLALKMGLWVAGMFLLAPMGAAELIIVLSDSSAAIAPPGAGVKEREK